MPSLIRTLNYRADIDGMRAVAVLLVLIFHFSLLPAVTAGFLGVDIFFVISGFLITTIIKKQLDADSFSLAAFYVNRIRRLAPTLFVVLLMVILAGVLWLFPTELVELSKQALASQFYVANIYYWRTINYFGLGAQDTYLLHTWSLAVEEQFYLMFPVCLLMLHRRLRRYFWAAIIIGCLVSFGLNIFFVGRKPEAAFYLLPTRAWELLMGAILPLLGARRLRHQYTDELLGILGCALVVAGATCYQINYHVPGFYALLPSVGAACVILAGGQRSTGVSRVLAWKPLVSLGQISYTLYLVHWPVNVFATVLITNYSLRWRLAMFLFSIVLAAFIYHGIENPVRLKRVISANPNLLAAYGSGLAVTVAAVAIVNISGGLPQRFPPDVVRLASYVNDKTDPLTECEYLLQPVVSSIPTCRIGAVGRSPTWLVYGDSHAWAAHAVFDQWLRQNNEAGLLVFRHACPPLTDIHLADSKDSCFEFNQAVTRFIEDQGGLKNILLVSTWRWPVDGGLLNSSRDLLTKQESIQLFTGRFVATIGHLSDLGRNVYVWEPVPGARGSVPLGLARAAWQHTTPNLEIDLSEYLSVNKLFFEALAQSRRWVTASFSPSQTLCTNGKCAVALGGNPLYFDNAHIAKSSADIWVQVLQRGMVSR